MPKRPLYLYNEIFAAAPGGGNSSWVVPYADELSDAQMGDLADVLSTPATAFVLGAGTENTRIRFFSPTGEFSMCGHAVVAAVCTLAEMELLPSAQQPASLRLQTPTGEVVVEASRSNSGRRHCAMYQQRPWFKATSTLGNAMAAVLGIAPDLIDPELPLETGSTGLKHVFVPLLTKLAMSTVRPDFAGLKNLSDSLGVESVAVFSQDTGDAQVDVLVRDFCPAIGVNEEAASGTTNGAVASYLVRHGRLQPDRHGDVNVTARQGAEMGRPSAIQTQIRVEAGAVEAVKVGGTANQLATAMLNL